MFGPFKKKTSDTTQPLMHNIYIYSISKISTNKMKKYAHLLFEKQQQHPSELFSKSAATQQLLFCTPIQNRSLISTPKVKHTWFLSKIFPKNQVTGTRCEIEHPQTTCWVLGGKPISKNANLQLHSSPAQNRRTKASTSYFFFGSVNSKALFASPPNHFPGSSAHRWLSCHKNLRKNTRNNSIFKHGSISSEHQWWVQ